MPSLSKKLEKEVVRQCGPALEKGDTKGFLDCSRGCYQQYKNSRLPMVRRIIFESRRELIRQTLSELENKTTDR